MLTAHFMTQAHKNAIYMFTGSIKTSCFPVPAAHWSPPPFSSSPSLLNIKQAVVCFMLLATHYDLMLQETPYWLHWATGPVSSLSSGQNTQENKEDKQRGVQTPDVGTSSAG